MAGAVCGAMLISGSGVCSSVIYAEASDYYYDIDSERKNDAGIKDCNISTYEENELIVGIERKEVNGTSFYDYDGVHTNKLVKKKSSYNTDNICTYFSEYDTNGNVTKVSYDGNIENTYSYEYNYYDNGNMKEVKSYGTDGIIRYEKEYDTKGRCIKETNYNIDGSISNIFETSYNYDANGKVILENGTGGNSEFVYDERGNIVKSLYSDKNGKLIYYCTYKYDNSNNLLRYIFYYADGTRRYTYGDDIEYEYDKFNNKTHEIWYGEDDYIAYEYFYEYNESNLLTNRKGFNYVDSESLGYDIGYTTIYEYDSNNNCIKYREYDLNDELTGYTLYEYYEDSETDTEDKKTDVTDDDSKDDKKSDETKADETKKDDTKSDDTKSDDTKPDKESASNPEPIGDKYSTYESNDFYRDEAGDTRCYDSTGAPVINEFKCDGTYTYYFQLDGTAMKDRLSYHPDGVHVIYFDAEGHEVFSDFANVKKTIAGEDVNDFCFFNVFGYMYVDVLTYDKTGTYLYYANPYGVMEMGKWFQFSDTVKWADDTPADGIAGGYGYAQEDGTLLTNTQTYDWEGRLCYLQGNGVAAY